MAVTGAVLAFLRDHPGSTALTAHAEGTGGPMTTITRPRGVGRRTAHDPGDPLVTSH